MVRSYTDQGHKLAAVGGTGPVCMVQVGSHCQSQKSNGLMITKIISFIADIHPKLSEWWMEFEIWGGILPHLNGDRNGGYRFSSNEELQRQIRQDLAGLQSALRKIEQAGRAMPKAYGEAFRFIAYRDITGTWPGMSSLHGGASIEKPATLALSLGTHDRGFPSQTPFARTGFTFHESYFLRANSTAVSKSSSALGSFLISSGISANLF